MKESGYVLNNFNKADFTQAIKNFLKQHSDIFAIHIR